jgi:antitoxin component YwqK of YwqJK toxin-antitoxin module
MKNNILLLMTSCTLAFFAGCTPRPVTKDSDPVKSNYIHKYGVEVDDAVDWNERGASGQVIKQLKNGATLTETWRDGVLDGPTTITFPHTSVIYQEMIYDKGTCIKETTNYHSGMPKQQKLHGPNACTEVVSWYEDGLPQTREQYQDLRLLSGTYVTPAQDVESEIAQGQGERPVRDGYGQLKGKEIFSDGLLAMSIELYPNGMPKSHTPYNIQGVIQGTRKTFSPSGDPQTIGEWSNNLPNGPTLIFQNGEKIAAVPYVDGKKNGVERQFLAGTCDVVAEITWNDDLRHGPSIVYVDDKKLTDWYFEGEKVSRVEFVERTR